MLKFLENHLSLVILFGLFIGMTLGNKIAFLGDYTLYILMAIMLLSAFKIEYSQILNCLKTPLKTSSLSFIKLIIFPISMFLLSFLFPEKYRIGMILLGAAPAGVSIPALLSVLKGNVNQGLIVMIITNLLAPFTIPLILFYTVGSSVEIDVLAMMKFLSIAIFVPFSLALFLKKFFPKVEKTLSNNSGGLLSIAIFTLVISVISPYSNFILSNLATSLWAFLIVFFCSAFFHIFSMFLTYGKARKQVVTTLIIMAYFNSAFMIVIAKEYFDSVTVLITVLYQFFWVFGLIPIQFIFAKNKKLSNNARA